jgi:hypothetical protein
VFLFQSLLEVSSRPIHDSASWIMMRAQLFTILAWQLGNTMLAASEPQPIVSQLHVLSIHVRDHAAFDGVYRLLGKELDLPLIYREPSQSNNEAERLYAGFSVGNTYLEPCGPYASDPPFTAAQPARFCGMTFRPASTLKVAAERMAQQSMKHSDVPEAGGRFSLVQTWDARLTGRYQAVGLWTINDPQDRLNLSCVKSTLAEAKGGALGVKRLLEIRIRYAGEDSLKQWSNFLAPARHEGQVWFVGDGPALRFISSKEPYENQVEGIVLEVESLEKAKQVLAARRLLGKATSEGIELEQGRTFGLKILFRQTNSRSE